MLHANATCAAISSFALSARRSVTTDTVPSWAASSASRTLPAVPIGGETLLSAQRVEGTAHQGHGYVQSFRIREEVGAKG
jgi:hypothetical protein